VVSSLLAAQLASELASRRAGKQRQKTAGRTAQAAALRWQGDKNCVDLARAELTLAFSARSEEEI